MIYDILLHIILYYMLTKDIKSLVDAVETNSSYVICKIIKLIKII